MRKEVITVACDSKIDTLRELFRSSIETRTQRKYLVADKSGLFCAFFGARISSYWTAHKPLR